MAMMMMPMPTATMAVGQEDKTDLCLVGHITKLEEAVKIMLKPCTVLSESKLLAVHCCDHVQPYIADLSRFKQKTELFMQHHHTVT